MSRGKGLVVVVAVVVVAGLVVAGIWSAPRPTAADTDGDGRGQTAAWEMNPKGDMVLHSKATTTNSLDRTLELEVQDAAGSVLVNFSIGCSPGKKLGVFESFEPLKGYPSGSEFTIIGRYYTLGDTLIDTESIRFSKP